MAWPTELKLKKSENTLAVTFDDGKAFVMPALYLRKESPSAEVQGHGGVKPVVHINAGVRIEKLEPVGNYAVRIVFDDGHSSGIYSWTKLRELGEAAG
jgi:DUF971 family protein